MAFRSRKPCEKLPVRRSYYTSVPVFPSRFGETVAPSSSSPRRSDCHGRGPHVDRVPLREIELLDPDTAKGREYDACFRFQAVAEALFGAPGSRWRVAWRKLVLLGSHSSLLALCSLQLAAQGVLGSAFIVIGLVFLMRQRRGGSA